MNKHLSDTITKLKSGLFIADCKYPSSGGSPDFQTKQSKSTTL